MFEEFRKLNFTEKEVKICLALWVLGRANVRQIGYHTLISRTTIYSVLRGLVDEGYVEKTPHREGDRLVEYFVPGDPAILLDKLKHKRAQIDAEEAIATQLVFNAERETLPGSL